MRSPKETAKAVEEAVSAVNRLYYMTTSAAGNRPYKQRTHTDSVTFKNRYMNERPIDDDLVSYLIQMLSYKYKVPVKHIKTVGQWDY